MNQIRHIPAATVRIETPPGDQGSLTGYYEIMVAGRIRTYIV